MRQARTRPRALREPAPESSDARSTARVRGIFFSRRMRAVRADGTKELGKPEARGARDRMAEDPSAARVVSAPGVRTTPDELALRAARRLVAELCPPFRVLDPACGDGALLCAVWRAAGASRSLARE